jgi:apolipoprotein N-acyltransferase
MATVDPSLSDVLRNIVADIQELMRSEIRFAKAELREEAGGIKSSAILIGAGALTGLYALFFALYSIVLALAIVLPEWAAALIVATILAVAGGIALFTGTGRFKRQHITPDRTIASIKENIEWAKQQTK